MAEVHGVAGEWARVKGTVYGLWPLFLGVFGCGFFVALSLFVSAAVGLVLVTIALIAMGWSFARGLRHIERYFKGAKGEEKISGILANLSSQYHIYNDFIAGGEHIDHVVIGPAGVFAVETKFWSGEVTIEEGRLLVNGQLPSRSPLSQVTKEAALVRSELAARGWVGPVTPVLAFASDTFKAHIAELNGAVIMNSEDLKKAFDNSRECILQSELERLVLLMENN